MPETATEPSGRIILVAEDNEDDILLLKRAFSKAGLAKVTVFVRDGEEIIKYLCRLPPFDDPMLCPRAGLLLLDVRMPKLDGMQVLEWLQAHAEVGPLTIVLCTSDLNEKKRARATELGATGCLEKPVRGEDWPAFMNSVRRFAGEGPVTGEPG